ncbi:MAG: hypothetical protein JJU02_08900 [Cryomorphaceae bacterium]|nr:hypothetical protein [Cryomorphaceae bacterium]
MKKIILVSNILFSFIACTNKGSHENHGEHEHHEEIATQHQHDDEQTISLNNGEKWFVNEEMKPFILEAENILIEYINNNSTDHKTLAVQLKEKNSGLIKNCTMKGESHDELHNWLHPHIDLIKKLEQEEDAGNAPSIVKELVTSFETYHQYFQ